MTIINCTVNQSGSSNPLNGYIQVVSNNYLTSNTVFYTSTPVKYPLVAGTVSFDLIPTDISKVAYNFRVISVDSVSLGETLLYQFDAVVPFSPTPINMVTLAPQSGLRYDRRDASLLTLARFLSSNDSFINFLGDRLWSNKGTWSPTVVYKRGDVVLRLNSSYQYIATTQAANIVPESNPLTWTLLVTGSATGTAAFIPVGTMFLFASTSSAPIGYLRCNGATVSRATYSVLFSVIGIAYGGGDGSSTFNIPDSPVNGDSAFIIYAGA